MSNYGIDYSGRNGTVNRDPETGIRYGIISAHNVTQWLWDEVESEYWFGCPDCGEELSPDEYDNDRIICPQCGKENYRDNCWGEEPTCHYFDSDEVKFFIDSYCDIWVTKSKYVTFAQYCSPCAPGACYLSNPVDEGGQLAFCLPDDWFDKEDGQQCPYPIYDLRREKNLLHVVNQEGTIVKTIVV